MKDKIIPIYHFQFNIETCEATENIYCGYDCVDIPSYNYDTKVLSGMSRQNMKEAYNKVLALCRSLEFDFYTAWRELYQRGNRYYD